MRFAPLAVDPFSQHQPWNRNQREDQQMHVVRHHDPGAKIVEAPLVGADQDGVRDQIGNPLVFEP